MNTYLSKPRLIFLGVCAILAIGVTAVVPGPLHRLIRESFLSRVTSPHYRVLFDRTVSASAAQDFANQREPLFAALNRRLGGAAEGVRITVVFDPATPLRDPTGAQRDYVVDKSTIRTTPQFAQYSATPPGSGSSLVLDSAADSEAMLYGVWGKPGSAELGYWTALLLVGERHGEELGMAAAQLEQRTGYKNVAAFLSRSPSPSSGPRAGTLAPDDRALLGAAWLNEIAEFGGIAEVHKLYAARMSKLDLAAVSAALGTTTPEVERKWQLWLYSNVAGMPGGATHDTAMPGMPGMPMPSTNAAH